MAINVGKAPKTQQKTQFYNPKPNESSKLTLLSDTDKIVTVDQCEIWGINPAIIWPQNEGYDPSRELMIRPALRPFMWVLVDDDPEPRIWAMRTKQHQELLDIKEANDGESLLGMIIQVKRTGSGMESKYSTQATPKRAKSLPKDLPTPEMIIDRLNVRSGEVVKEEIISAFKMEWPEIVSMFIEKHEADQARRRKKKNGEGSPEEGDVEAL